MREILVNAGLAKDILNCAACAGKSDIVDDEFVIKGILYVSVWDACGLVEGCLLYTSDAADE